MYRRQKEQLEGKLLEYSLSACVNLFLIQNE